MKRIDPKGVDVFLDLDPDSHGLFNATNSDLASILIGRFKPIMDSIGKRIRGIKPIGIAYDTPSVALFEQAKDLYLLGYFVSSIIICRSIAEYLAYEIFYEEVELEGSPDLLNNVAENLDFRKIVNEFLYNSKKGIEIIDKDSHVIFNEVYSVGNNWIHPNNKDRSEDIELESKKMLEKTHSLITSLRNVMKDYDVSNGKLIKRSDARKKKRPIVLGASLRKIKRTT